MITRIYTVAAKDVHKGKDWVTRELTNKVKDMEMVVDEQADLRLDQPRKIVQCNAMQ